MKTTKDEITSRLEQIKKRGANKTCFDCGEKGTTYAAMNFGTFVCSRCAGLLRELNFKVKGTGVSIFTEKEVDLLDTVGNENARKTWMGKFDEDRDKMPNPKNSDEVKRHLSKDDVLKITRCILNHKHDKNIASIVVRELSEELPQLTVSKVNHILYKNSWKSLTDEYFMKGDFI